MTVAPFWDWALRQYAREPTQALLLTLQSQADLVILEVLFAAWLSTEGHRLEAHDVAAMRATTETWIDEVIIESYVHLHELGLGHSVECWDEDGLQGGLYGVALGRAFFGESMFSRKADASKVALVHLVEWLREENYLLLDTQWMTDHLRQFGGEEVTREDYFKYLDEALEGIYEDPVQNLQDGQSRS